MRDELQGMDLHPLARAKQRELLPYPGGDPRGGPPPDPGDAQAPSVYAGPAHLAYLYARAPGRWQPQPQPGERLVEIKGDTLTAKAIAVFEAANFWRSLDMHGNETREPK